jgi:uncharacterized protein (TIGR00251 family)
MALPEYLKRVEGGVLLAVKLQPRASANRIEHTPGNELRVRVTAPPVDSAANEALVRVLAERLDCGKGKIELVKGQTSRHKLLKLYGFTAEQVLALLSESSGA